MSMLSLDPAAFAPYGHRLPGSADRPPVAVRHRVAHGGLLELERLALLAERLRPASIEHNLGAVPSLLPGGEAPQAALTPGEIVRSIESNGCWMVLKNIEADPEYRALLDACVDEVEPAVTAQEGRSLLREGFVFLSAPGSVTPAHIDPEHNILLQVRGTKTMRIGRFEHDHAMALQCEQLHTGGHRNLGSPPVDLVDFPLGPGDGVYVPVHAPHTVLNGPTVSVSLSVTWRTRSTLRAGRVLTANARSRAHGGSPDAPGGSVLRDEVVSAAQRGRSLLRRLR